MTLVSKAFSDIVTFSRSSNATRIGPNGLVQYAPHNLLLQSQTFDNASWTKNSATVTANSTAAPDGTITADRLIPNSGTNSFTVVNQGVSITNGLTYAISIYVKKDAFRYFYIYADGAPLNYGQARADLDTGTIITGTGSVTSVGNGWFRFTGIFNAVAGGTSFIFLGATNSSSTFSTTGDGVTGTYIWGAQLAVGPLALDYTPTTTAAVYGPRFDYDGSGVTIVEPVSRNLLTYSEQFDNAAWVKLNTTVTANAISAPDGTVTADKLIESANSASHGMDASSVTITSGIAYTSSVFFKAGERRYVFLALSYGPFTSGNGVCFDLQTGTIVGTGTGSSNAGNIISVGNGWYRCSITLTAISTQVAQSVPAIYILTAPSNSISAYTGDGTSGIYLWGAQLEIGSTATGYMVSGATNGFRAVPVVSGSATARGLLVEEQRTNLLTYSEQFNNAYWLTFSGTVTVTANATTAPDGTVTADLVIPSAASDFHRIFSPDLGQTTLSYSVFVKAGGYSKVALRESATLGSYISFNLTTGTIIESGNVGSGTASGATITSFGNGWYRISGYFVTPVNSAWGLVVLPDSYTSGNVNTAWTGNGTSGVYVWGAQAEVASFASSYIPTLASTVTRSADVASVNTLSPWFNATEGTLFAEANIIGKSVFNNPSAFFTDGTENNAIYTLNNPGEALVISGGATQFDEVAVGSTSVNTVYKAALAFKANDFAASYNGSTPTTDTSGTVPTVSALYLGRRVSGSGALNGHLRRVAFFPRRLSNAELVALSA